MFKEATEEIKNKEYLIITAGAGMGVDSEVLTCFLRSLVVKKIILL